MRIKTELFCSLATSPVWQTWLFEYDKSLYSNFMQDLKKSKNCSENKTIMVSLLDKIYDRGGQTLLFSFLSQKFPYIVQSSDPKQDQHGVFPGYVPGLLSYPRRIVFKGAPQTLESVISKFTADKTHFDSLILDNVAYVEYLDQGDIDLFEQIPEDNWMIRAYRAKHPL